MSRKFTVGDIHGCYYTLTHLLFDILKITKEDEIIFLGDYIDRGPFSKEVLDFLIDKIGNGYRFYPLMGNHEYMMLSSYFDDSILDLWYFNAGETTLKSFSIASIQEIDLKYIDFLKSLKKFHISERYVLVHAGLNFELENPFEDEYAMLWARKFIVDKSKIGNRKLIGGHTPTTLEDIKNSLKTDRIFLDGGCVYKNIYPGYGYLCALNLDNDELYYVERID